MPLFRIGERLVFFAHVPRCAGTALENYLQERFGPAAFLDRRYLRAQREFRPWNRSSPQHVPALWLDRLFPKGFIDISFAVVRHPLQRILSVFQYQRDIEGRIAREATFSGWLQRLPDITARDPFAYDNHARPMDDLVPTEAAVFRIEDGLAAVVAWLDELAGNRDGPRGISPVNSRAGMLKRGEVLSTDDLSAGDRARVAQLFRNDFRRFNYG